MRIAIAYIALAGLFLSLGTNALKKAKALSPENADEVGLRQRLRRTGMLYMLSGVLFLIAAVVSYLK